MALVAFFPRYTQVVLDGQYKAIRIVNLFLVGVITAVVNFCSDHVNMILGNKVGFHLNRDIINNLVRAKYDFYNKKR